MYYYGDGVGADFSKAVGWYTRAAEHGHEKAKAKIAELSK
jgi:TPR repeat protein